ncbi:SCO7613 C-terminal domain-containing membrane protein [Micromonospora mangrovi]|uniref:SCO7613 C-terminal domain-containing membrane protein n=1 Tax=Micromonospora mangrovi TaxID=1182597 RepID=A0ABV8M806_9ACTN
MENTGYPCPGCGAPADLVAGCPGCGRPPYPPAAEVVRLDREIATLAPEVERARVTYQDLLARLGTARQRRSELAARIRAEIPPPTLARPVPVRPAPPAPLPATPAPLPATPAPLPATPPTGYGVPARPGRPETSTRTVQGLLFVLGGLLLGTAAIVFTAVAWAAVGVAGRALILVAVTVLALAVPLVARWRGLRGTAETFAAVGLLLVLLDGYAAWSVDLAGVADWPGTRYAALVGGAGAAIAAGYALLSRLTVPWFAALLIAQPVLPLLTAAARPSAAGWALVLTAVALGDLVMVVALRGRGVAAPAPVGAPGGGVTGGGPVHPAPMGIGAAVAGGGPVAAAPVGPAILVGSPAVVAGRVLGWLGYAVALAAAAGCALVPLALGRAAGTPLLAGGPLLMVALALHGGALLAGGRTFRVATAGLLVPVLATALLRPVGALRPGLLLVAAAVIGLGLAGAVRLLPARLRTGPRVGALVVAAGLAQVGASLTAYQAGRVVDGSLPAWRGADAVPAPHWGWQLPVAVLLTAAAAALLLPRAARPVVGVLGGTLAVLAAPAIAATPWPTVVAVDLVAGAALLLAAVLRPRTGHPTVLTPALAGAALTAHGLLVALADPAGPVVALAVVVVVGLAVAARGRRGHGVQPAVGGGALLAAVLAVPVGVAVGLFAVGAPAWWQLRGVAVAAGVLVLGTLAVRRHWPDLLGYASTGLAGTLVLLGVAPLVVPAAEPVAGYAALGVLLALASGGGGRPAPAPRVAGVALAGLAALATAPTVLRVLGGLPVRPWSGVPAVEPVRGAWGAGAALLLLAAAGAAYLRIVRGGRWLPATAALPFAALALPVLLAAVPAPWPVTPAVAYAVGVAALLVAALAAPRPALVPVAVPVGLVLGASGLAGLLATRAGTLAGLGVLVVAAAAVGTAGRHPVTRLAGWPAAVLAATGFALTASLAGGLPVRTAAFAVLAVAVAALHAAPLLARREAAAASTVGLAVEAAGQAVALLAVLLAWGALRHAATVCVLWGVAVALRVLRRGESPARRRALAAIAGVSELLGGWLLLAAGGVVLLEAYTVPAAVLALAAGLVALGGRPGLTSWLALGPGLVAALLPSLVSVLVAPDPQPWRRLALGAAAVAAVLVGAVRRWQAPAVLGSVVLVPLALHELARGWDLLPRWIFLAVGGLALIGLAATYERRRRDLHRLRSVVGRMG